MAKSRWERQRAWHAIYAVNATGQLTHTAPQTFQLQYIDIGIDDVYDSDYDPSFAETIGGLQNTRLR